MAKMIELASKTQKLVRDSRVSLPYHRPKQLTLDEFLNRRNIVKDKDKDKVKVPSDLVNTDVTPTEECLLPHPEPAEVGKLPHLESAEGGELPHLESAEGGELPHLESAEGGELPHPEPAEGGELPHPEPAEGGKLPHPEPAELGTLPHPEPVDVGKLPHPEPADVNTLPHPKPAEVDTLPHPERAEGGTLPHPERAEGGTLPHPEPAEGGKLPQEEDVIKDIVVEAGQEAVIPQGQQEIELIQEKEAELAAFLNEQNPKPKKKTIREMLKEMPGYDDFVKRKPGIGGGETKNGIIELDDFKKPVKSCKTEEKIQILLAKLAKHTFTSVGTSHKSEVHKLRVNKTEKDSQGLLHSVVDEIEYVEPPPSESQDDFLAQINRPSGTSPREPIPGEKLVRLRNYLQERIRDKRNKQWEERTKLHAIYNEEKELEDKEHGDYPEDEEPCDDEEIEISDSEDEEEEEEDVTDHKQRRPRIKYIDDEAEDEDNEISDSEDEEEEDKENRDYPEDEELCEDEKIEKSDSEDEEEEDEVTDHKKKNRCITYSDDEDEAEDEKTEIRDVEDEEEEGKIQILMAKLDKNTEGSSEDILDLCSGQFPSQAPPTPYETQNCFGFDDDSDDEQFVQTDEDGFKGKETCTKSITPDNGSALSAGNTDTEDEQEGQLALQESTPKTKSMFRNNGGLKKKLFDMEAEVSESEKGSGDEDERGNTFYEDEEGDQERLEEERQLALQQSKPKAKGLFGKNGRLKKKFYDEEAELSGSEEGSGDEDERGINFYEDEEGDQDELDEEAVKNEVERAHLKHLLDTDDRQIRQLREEYLERGDLEDGKLRERKFRWFDVEDNFNDDDTARTGDSDGELGGDDDEEEIKRKLQEIERRKWIHEHSQLFETPEEESQKLFENSKFLKLGKSTMKKIESLVDNTNTSFSMNESSNSVPDPSFASLFKSKIKSSTQAILSAGGPTEEASEFDEHLKLNKAMSQPLFASPDNPLIKIKKGSFLNRGSPALSRMAEFTKVNESLTTVKSNSRNFVFSVVTPPDQASNKLKVPKRQAPSQGISKPTKMPRMDRSFNNLDDKSKNASIFKWI